MSTFVYRQSRGRVAVIDIKYHSNADGKNDKAS
jgi:hypothetical protein